MYVFSFINFLFFDSWTIGFLVFGSGCLSLRFMIVVVDLV